MKRGRTPTPINAVALLLSLRFRCVGRYKVVQVNKIILELKKCGI